MNWYKKAQSDTELVTEVKRPKFRQGQNVIVYADDKNESGTGTISNYEYFPVEDKYYYRIQFDESNDDFNENKKYKEENIIVY